MGKRKGELHPADRERKREAEKRRKINAEIRRKNREESLKQRTADDIEEEVEKIKRMERQGLADSHLIDRRHRLEREIDAANQREIDLIERRKREKEEAAKVNIRGLSKIFKGANKAAAGGGEEEDEDDDEGRDPYAAPRSKTEETAAYIYNDKARAALPLALLPGAGPKKKRKLGDLLLDETKDASTAAAGAAAGSSTDVTVKPAPTPEQLLLEEIGEIESRPVPDAPPGLDVPPDDYVIPEYPFGRGLEVKTSQSTTVSAVEGKAAAAAAATGTIAPGAPLLPTPTPSAPLLPHPLPPPPPPRPHDPTHPMPPAQPPHVSHYPPPPPHAHHPVHPPRPFPPPQGYAPAPGYPPHHAPMHHYPPPPPSTAARPPPSFQPPGFDAHHPQHQQHPHHQHQQRPSRQPHHPAAAGHGHVARPAIGGGGGFGSSKFELDPMDPNPESAHEAWMDEQTRRRGGGGGGAGGRMMYIRPSHMQTATGPANSASGGTGGAPKQPPAKPVASSSSDPQPKQATVKPAFVPTSLLVRQRPTAPAPQPVHRPRPAINAAPDVDTDVGPSVPASAPAFAPRALSKPPPPPPPPRSAVVGAKPQPSKAQAQEAMLKFQREMQALGAL